MAHTDPLADMLTRVRNAGRAHQASVNVPFSMLKQQVAQALVNEGFLGSVEIVNDGVRKTLVLALRYTDEQKPVISHLTRVSKPGRRVYMGYTAVQPVRNGMGVTILSTPKGILTDAMARQQKVGGELLCSVW